MNWGKVITLILAVFVLFIGWMSYVMFKSPTDEYDHQYYEDGLNFDHDHDREEQVYKDHAQPFIQADTCFIKFTFPQKIKGKVIFMRPSSDVPDKIYALSSDSGQTVDVLTKNMAKGKWQLVIDWKSNKKAYLYQQEIYLP